MNLKEKINTINAPKITTITNGKACSVKEFFDKVVVPFLPSKEVMEKTHRLLIDYVNNPKAVFAIRAFNSESKGHYDKLRRGFLNLVGNTKFFYTDNFFAHYFAKMMIDGYVPSLDELIDMMNNRTFPARFGPNCMEERKLLAMGKGKDPGLTSAGYKVAHIYPVGKNYLIDNKTYNMTALTSKYFPRGERSDWKVFKDQFGSFHMRVISEKDLSKSILKAIFLRFVHPLNYIITPNTVSEINDKNPGMGIGEYEELLKLAHNYFLTTYPDMYKEYLRYIYPLDGGNNIMSYDNELHIEYGYKINKKEVNKIKKETMKSKAIVKEINATAASTDTVLKMAAIYLKDEYCSFRKLEIEVMGIKSPARGGGFKAKTALNNIGITADMKGILAHSRIQDLLKVASSEKAKALTKVKPYL